MTIPLAMTVLGGAGIMTQALRRFLLIGLGSSLIAACAGDKGQYPSLAIRDVERAGGLIDTGPPVEPVPLNIAPIIPSSSIAQLVEQARASHNDFLAREPSVRSLATGARGTGRDSDVRGRAIIALADLTSLRSRTEIPLADLDLLIAERTNRFESAEDAIAAHAEVLSLVNQQDRTLDNLWSILGQ